MTTTASNLSLTPWREPVAPAALKSLEPTTQPLKDLTFADYVVGSRSAEKTPHDDLVHNVQTWVSQTFYGTILKQMRNSPFKSELFEGGRGGQAFGGLMDQHLADRMARSGNNKLVNSIVRRMEARSAYSKNPSDRSDTDVTSALRA